jgi:hypothetical protein
MAYGTLAERLKRPLVAGIFIGLGFLATYGWWGWILWREFANPFFPYFNSIFQSPWWSPVDFFDRNFGPRNWRQAIFFPLYFAREHLLVARDQLPRLAIRHLFVLALMSWAISRWRNLRENPNAPHRRRTPSDAAWRILALFALVSYLAWLKVFGIYRYLAAWRSSRARSSSAACCTSRREAACAWHRGRADACCWSAPRAWRAAGAAPSSARRYFDVVRPSLAPDALVIVGYRHR